MSFAAPPLGTGKIFTVPEGAPYVVFSVNTTANATPSLRALAGPMQVQKGEVATTIEAYSERLVVPPEHMPAEALTPGGGGGGGGEEVPYKVNLYRYIGGEDQPYNRDRWTAFSEGMLLKNRDLTMVIPGTSLTARSIEYCSPHPLAKYRPPLMHALNTASHLYDLASLGWGQKHARYDASEFVTETAGTWATSHNRPEWDDGAYRNGLTRYSESNGAAVSFLVPAGTWAWRFIDRTDSVASTAVQVAISGGNGIAQVYDRATSAWVEANGYMFSQREPAPVTRSISIPNPDTGAFASLTIASKGNTTYQRRTKFRWINRTADSIITFTNTVNGTRFNYWGAGWSAREFMLTVINAARGSHNTQATSTEGLPRFADNEIHSFKPDLIYGELPIHNDGAYGIATYPTWDRWGRLAENYAWNPDYELSLATRAAYFGYTPEFGFWTPSIGYMSGAGGISATGELLTSVMGDGRVMTALDKIDQAVNQMRKDHPEAVIIHVTRRWIEAGIAIYGDLKTATDIGGMLADGVHPGDIGSAVIAKPVRGPLSFVN